ncbi:MAG TPA: TonB-dependent receptor [Rhizomicrobium sp.]|nr:TonB-dependent receptor [Rhizomicrobium sp.]
MSTGKFRQLSAAQKYLLGALLASTALGNLSTAARAQEASGGIETVVVTAERREEQLQDVPIAAVAFSQDQLRQMGVDRLEDIVRSVPNVTLYDDRGAGQPTWVIRGVGLADFNPNNTPTAAVFYDEFYLPSNELAGVGMFDIQRVEVLKGPQGGLYGRNTSGGAVRVLSNRPDFDGLSGYIDASYGSWNRTQAQGAVNVPVADNVAIRVAGMIDRGGGWQDSLATPQNDHWGDHDFTALRGQIRIKPTESSDILFKAEWGHNGSETELGRSVGTENLAEPSTGLPGNPDAHFCPAVLAGYLDDSTCGTWADRNNILHGNPPSPTASDQTNNASVVLSNPINKLDNTWYDFNLQASNDFGFATLTSITGWMHYLDRQPFDYDGSQLVLGHESSRVKFDVWSQEFRLVSDDSGPFTWLAGASYNADFISDQRTFDFSDNTLSAPPPINFVQRGYHQSSRAWAIYGNAAYNVTDDVKIHGSIRYTDEHKVMNDAYALIPALSFYLFQDVTQTLDLHSHWVGDAGVDYHPWENAMLYAKATRGYKSGGFFGGIAADPVDLLPYKEETIWSYEIGAKTTWMDQLVANAAAFYYDYSNRQGYLNILNPITGTPVSRLGNVGDVAMKGAELELTWAPPQVPGLTLGFNPAYLTGKIVDSDATTYTITGILYSLQGLPINAPMWSYTTSGSYEHSITDDLTGSISLDYAWRRSPNPTVAYAANNLVTYAIYHIPSYGTLNGRIAIASEAGKWELALEGKNLTDAAFWTVATRDSAGSYMHLYNQPRNWRLEFNYKW